MTKKRARKKKLEPNIWIERH